MWLKHRTVPVSLMIVKTHLMFGGWVRMREYVVKTQDTTSQSDDGKDAPDVGRVGEYVREGLAQVRDEHAELSAPVAHVVDAQHVVAAELQHPGNVTALGSDLVR